jgi:hypothetical protein
METGMILPKMIANFLMGLDNENINALLRMARAQIVVKSTAYGLDELRGIARNQIDKLQSRLRKLFKNPPHPAAITFLEKYQEEAIQAASKLRIPKNNIPLLPVIPLAGEGSLPISDQIKLLDGELGGNFIKKISQAILGTWFINVEDGTFTKGWASRQAMKIFSEQRRFGLDAAGCISLAFHSEDTLSKHGLNAIRSIVNGNKREHACLHKKETIALIAGSFSAANEDWGTPSYQIEI